MELRMIGLGWMRSNMVKRLINAGHHVIRLHKEAVEVAVRQGAYGLVPLPNWDKS